MIPPRDDAIRHDPRTTHPAARLFARSKLVEEAVEKFIKEMPVEHREERKDEKQCRRP